VRNEENLQKKLTKKMNSIQVTLILVISILLVSQGACKKNIIFIVADDLGIFIFNFYYIQN
jgi:hypothetical protein